MNRLLTALNAGVVAVMLSSGAYAGDAVVTPAQIEAARTPADHEAIAAAYDREAARLEALASEHRAMAKAYAAQATTQKGMNGPAMTQHCTRLADKYMAAAKENRELAKEHRAMKEKAAGQT